MYLLTYLSNKLTVKKNKNEYMGKVLHVLKNIWSHYCFVTWTKLFVLIIICSVSKQKYTNPYYLHYEILCLQLHFLELFSFVYFKIFFL